MEEYKKEVIKNGYNMAIESLVWSTISFKAGEATREDYMTSNVLINAFQKKADEVSIELEDNMEEVCQNAFKTCADAFWMSRMIDETGMRSGMENDMLNQNVEGYYQGAKQLLKDEGITPEFTREDFLNQTYERVREDVYEADIAIDAGVLDEDDPDYKIALALKDMIKNELE